MQVENPLRERKILKVKYCHPLEEKSLQRKPATRAALTEPKFKLTALCLSLSADSPGAQTVTFQMPAIKTLAFFFFFPYKRFLYSKCSRHRDVALSCLKNGLAVWLHRGRSSGSPQLSSGGAGLGVPAWATVFSGQPPANTEQKERLRQRVRGPL